MSCEIWKKISKFPNYSISNLGRIRRDDTGRIRKTTICKKGYERVGLYPNYIGSLGPSYVTVHRLVAVEFLQNPMNKPEVNHKDGNKLNNCADNLEWCTASENIKHSYDRGLKVFPKGSDHFASKVKEEDILEIRRLYSTKKYRQKDIARMFGLCQQNISLICSNKAWEHTTRR